MIHRSSTHDIKASRMNATPPQRVLECSLWIGDLDAMTTEDDVRHMFEAVGEAVRQVRIMRDRSTGACLGYGFVSFDNDEQASGCLMRCNGKYVPGSNNERRFKLNYSNKRTQQSSSSRNSDDFSAFVGELSDEITESDLFNAFKQRYPSVLSAKVMMDESGRARGFGFVRFGEESEFQRACVEMNGQLLGGRAIRVSASTSRRGQGGPGRGGYGGQSGSYGQYGNSGQYGQSGQYSNSGQYGSHRSYGQSGQSGMYGQYN